VQKKKRRRVFRAGFPVKERRDRRSASSHKRFRGLPFVASNPYWLSQSAQTRSHLKREGNPFDDGMVHTLGVRPRDDRLIFQAAK